MNSLKAALLLITLRSGPESKKGNLCIFWRWKCHISYFLGILLMILLILYSLLYAVAPFHSVEVRRSLSDLKNAEVSSGYQYWNFIPNKFLRGHLCTLAYHQNEIRVVDCFAETLEVVGFNTDFDYVFSSLISLTQIFCFTLTFGGHNLSSKCQGKFTVTILCHPKRWVCN